MLEISYHNKKLHIDGCEKLASEKLAARKLIGLLVCFRIHTVILGCYPAAHQKQHGIHSKFPQSKVGVITRKTALAIIQNPTGFLQTDWTHSVTL